jgi:hypothetical protein
MCDRLRAQAALQSTDLEHLREQRDLIWVYQLLLDIQSHMLQGAPRSQFDVLGLDRDHPACSRAQVEQLARCVHRRIDADAATARGLEAARHASGERVQEAEATNARLQLRLAEATRSRIRSDEQLQPTHPFTREAVQTLTDCLGGVLIHVTIPLGRVSSWSRRRAF